MCGRTEVLVTLTTDVGKLLSKLSQVRPKGNISFVSAVRIAHVSIIVSFLSASNGIVEFNVPLNTV